MLGRLVVGAGGGEARGRSLVEVDPVEVAALQPGPPQSGASGRGFL